MFTFLEMHSDSLTVSDHLIQTASCKEEQHFCNSQHVISPSDFYIGRFELFIAHLKEIRSDSELQNDSCPSLAP